MQKLSAKQIHDIEKTAGLVSSGVNLLKSKAKKAHDWWKNTGEASKAMKAGQALGKPISETMGIVKKIISPLVKGTHNTASYIGDKVHKGVDKFVTPAGGSTAETIADIAGGAATAGAGFVGEIGKGAVKHVVSPVVKGYGKAMKKAPIQTLANTALIGVTGNEIFDKTKNRNFTMSNNNLDRYRNLTQRYKRSSEENTEKQASWSEGLKKGIGYGSGLSLLGIAGLASLPMASNALFGPTLNASGEEIKKGVFPLASRINAEEEKAKKELGIKTTYDMERQLGQQALLSKSVKDIPKIESNLQYLVDNDPIISEFVTQDPSRHAQLRETINTVYEFAPDIATNTHAAQSILRESAMSPDGGLHYNTVKQIADAQKTITQGRKR